MTTFVRSAKTHYNERKRKKNAAKKRNMYYIELEESSSKSFTQINLEASFIQSSICNARDKKTFKLATKTKTIRSVFRFAIWSLQIKGAKHKALPVLDKG